MNLPELIFSATEGGVHVIISKDEISSVDDYFLSVLLRNCYEHCRYYKEESPQAE